MNNIDSKINMLYDFIYVKSSNNIKPYNIDVKNITIDDIKIKKNDSSDYMDIITELFNCKLKMITYDINAKTLVLKRSNEAPSIALFITPYKSLSKIDNINSINNNDSLFSYLLSMLVINKKCKHIMLPIINIDVDFQQIVDIIKPYDNAYEDYMKLINNTLVSNIFSIRTTECFFKCMLLKDFIKSQKFNLKNLLFQVIYTLAILQKEYDGFRHNILNSDNIFVYLLKEYDNVVSYTYDDTMYYISNNIFEIKITNFYGASIPNLYTSDMKIPFIDMKQKNDYFDLQYFLNNLLHTIDIMNQEDIDFLNEVIPKKFRNTDNKLYMKTYDEYTTPAKLLKSTYFKEFTQKKDTTGLVSINDYCMGNKRILKRESNIKKFDYQRKMKGGGIYKKPVLSAMTPNSPFISNEQKRVYNMNKEPTPENTKNIEPEKSVIASQEILVNPYYKKPFTVKEKPKYFPDHVPFDKKHDIPQAKVSFDTRTIKKEEDSEGEKDSHSYDKDKKESYSYNKKEFHSYDKDKKESHSYDKDKKEFYSYDNKKDSYHKQERIPNITEQPLLAEQKLYQSNFSGAPSNVGHTHPKYTNPAFVSLDNSITYPPSFVPSSNQYFPFVAPPLQKINEIPLQQIYNINLGNPTVHNSTLNKIYQDMLPGDPYNFTMSSIVERNQLINFLRNSINDKRDGEKMTMQGGPTSIMEFIKILEFNPYRMGLNPYAIIPMDFLIYSGAFPIRYNAEKSRIEVAKYGLGLNIRIYKYSVGALYASELNLPNGTENFNVHRDIKYYMYIKDNILDKKISPNFITIILYKIDGISKINYKEMYTLIASHKDVTSNAIIQQNIKLNEQINKLFVTVPNYVNIATKLRIKDNLTIDSGKSMIVLTEAPTCNIIEWLCPTYIAKGAISEMTSTGYHSEYAWNSILFQLVYSMAVLQEKEIYIRNFSLENNVFIKDLFYDNNNIGYWIYCVEGINFYIPNFGSLLLIDTRFTDILPNLDISPTIFDNIINTTDKQIFKIVSPSIYTYNEAYIPDYKKTILKDMKNIIDINNFIRLGSVAEFKIIQPSGTTVELIKTINSSTETNIKDIMINSFPQYLHNRIGTFLTKSEVENINISILPQFNIGSLMVYQERYNEYKWVLYLKNISDKKKLIYTKNDTNMIQIEVFNYSLIFYPDANNLSQTSDKNYRLNNESLIETYTL